MIANGKTIIIVDQKVLKLDPWLKYHPGGDKAILHLVGRDATDEVNAYVKNLSDISSYCLPFSASSLHSAEARQQMSNFQIGRIEGRWRNFVPPIQGGTFEAIPIDETVKEQTVQDDEIPSPASSRPLTPIFDEGLGTGLQRKRSFSDFEETSSISSISSEEPDQQKLASRAAHMDAFTKEAIDLDLAKYPSLDDETQESIVQRYRLLNLQIRKERLYDCNYLAYFRELCRYTLLFCATLMCVHWGWYATGGLFMGVFWHQLVFSAHDAGHMGITHDFTIDTVLGIIIADFLGGLSLGWWKRNHNVHHIVTNSPEHDPDIEHMPIFAISHRFLDSLKSTYYDRVMAYDPVARFMVRYQQYLYYPVLTFGRFNLYRLSWEYLILGLGPKKGPAWWHRWFEIAGHLFFWAWFGYGLVYKSIPTVGGRLAFILVSHMVTAPLHVQITLSHFAMSTADLGVNESFPQKMLRTTMDVDCPDWLDFLHGGLQFQAIHHLYPRIPRHNLRRTQRLVQSFCREAGIPYALYGFVDGNKEVIGRLADVGRQAAILAECQKAVAEKGIHGHH